MIYAFDNCELDLDRVELRVGGTPRPIEAQVFDVLRVLVRDRERVVTKELLLDEVWRHRFVTDSAITSRVKSARQAIGDDGRAQRLIRTIHGRGYQFVGNVREIASSTVPTRSKLPAPATPTVGRETDLAALLDLLDRFRIVTLVGPGGVGKTRLAMEAAIRRSDAEGLDACFVDLTTISDAGDVPGAILRDLGIQASDGVDDGQLLNEALRARSLLLVLDNFEHVIDAAGVAARLVGSSEAVQVLVTSRTPLRVAGEHVIDVAPLSLEPVPDGPPPAVALFAQVAMARDPSFDLGRDLADVAAICRTVDGLPLAIELAAGHVRSLPPALLRTRLGARLGSPDLAPRDAPARHRTIPATIDWSLQLLSPTDRRLFARLGVFRGPAPLEAVEALGADLGGDVAGSLARLVDQSLVRRVAGVVGEPRFVLLELLRERARELLDDGGEGVDARRRHAAYMAAFVEDIEEHRWHDGAETWIDRILEALGDIRAAQGWAAEGGEPELAARITACLGNFWHSQGQPTGFRSWVEDALTHEGALDPLVVGRLRITAGFVEWPTSGVDARKHWTVAVDAFRALGHERYHARSLMLVAGSYYDDPDGYELAVRLCDDGVEQARRIGERHLLASALNIRGELARAHGDDETARATYEEALDIAIEVGHRSILLGNLAFLADHRGDHDEARRLGCDALRLAWSSGRWKSVATMVWVLAGPELGLGHPERAARLMGAGEGALRSLGVTLHPADRPEHERIVDALAAALGDATSRALREAGARLPLADAVELALATICPTDG